MAGAPTPKQVLRMLKKAGLVEKSKVGGRAAGWVGCA
jgi:ribosomal protein S19E (S16A)